MELVGQEKWIFLRLLIHIFQLPSKNEQALFLLKLYGLIFLMQILLDLNTII